MTSTFPDISISTDRLVLRPFDMADIPAYIEMMNDELVVAWTEAPYPYTQVDAERWVRRIAPAQRTGGDGIVLAVTEFLTQRLVGSVRLRNTDWRTRATEAAYITAPWARGEDTPPSPYSHWPSGSSATRASNASSCVPPPTTPPRNRSPRSSAASARSPAQRSDSADPDRERHGRRLDRHQDRPDRLGPAPRRPRRRRRAARRRGRLRRLQRLELTPRRGPDTASARTGYSHPARPTPPSPPATTPGD